MSKAHFWSENRPLLCAEAEQCKKKRTMQYKTPEAFITAFEKCKTYLEVGFFLHFKLKCTKKGAISENR